MHAFVNALPGAMAAPMAPMRAPGEVEKGASAGVEALRVAGNAAFKASNFGSAANLYSQALLQGGKSAALLSNRSAALMALGNVRPPPHGPRTPHLDHGTPSQRHARGTACRACNPSALADASSR